MSLEMALGIAGGEFLATSGLLLLATVRYGRRLFRIFEHQFPEQYAGAGTPWPAYLDSEWRRAHFRFLMQRESRHCQIRSSYGNLSDCDR